MRVDEETLRFDKTMREKSPRQILANVRRLYAKRRRIPNWALAMEIYGVGSTYGFWICREYGIDPDAYTIDHPSSSKANPDHTTPTVSEARG